MDLYQIKKYCLDTSSITKALNIKLLFDGEIFFNTFFDMISKAKKTILIEFYEIADDSIGEKLKDILIKKSDEGVKIRIIYDSIGSRLTQKSFFKSLRKKGIDVIEYNPINILHSIRKWFRRDHRKVVVVDFEKAIIGGFNISLDYAPYSYGGRNWKDFGVYFEGKAVGEVSDIFRKTWMSEKGAYFEIIKKDVDGDVPVSFVWEYGIRNMHSIRRSYKYAIDNAKDFIYITNAYFLPDGIISRSLKRAVMRGVDVRIILPFKTDHPYVRLASFPLVKNFITHGIKIYEWKKEVLHAKTAVIDGVWVSVGSHNLDHISLHYNLELNMNIFDSDIGRKMKELFENDLSSSKLLTVNDIKNLPLSTKLTSRILYFFRDFL